METELIISAILLGALGLFILSLLLMPGMGDLVPYLYLNGRIAVKEGRLVKAAHYQDMLNAHSQVEVVALLQNSAWSESFHGTTLNQAETPERIVAEEMGRLYRELLGMIPERLKGTFRFLSRTWDARNIKTVLRGLRKSDKKPELQPYGELPPEILQRMAEAEDREQLLSLLAKTSFAFLAEHFGKEENFLAWEDLLDRHVLEESWKEVNASRQLLVLRPYFAAKIDTKNILTLFRGKNAGIAWEEMSTHLIRGGEILPKLERKYGNSSRIEDFAESFRDTAYGELISRSLPDLAKEGTFFQLERELREFVLKTGRDIARLHPFGPAPVVGFLARKEAEAENIRAILKGKEAGFSPEHIRKFLIES